MVKCMKTEESRWGQRQKKYVDSFIEMLPIAMGKLSAELFEYVKKWEPDELVVDSILSMDTDGAEGMEVDWKKNAFEKTYKACVPVHVPTVNRAYLAIRHDLFADYVGKEVDKVYDCYIAEFSEDYKSLEKIGEEI